ncbi:indole-3-glycerol phosphate synthase [Bacillus ectoiniformans]|uniref:indole-3-glycerol phosphate synthase TrpC n=1 Tax=Bacillus ectoiniformans TaxID=1494429 RepID=UPI00195CCC06|nr:indole-3-glycerol phosphate synthase TrpC [Bacillus ectoiniformans]MBM7647745.1 indole-3-glycerol phosphate synthase [Bacillus ectoiniformans]
MTETILDRILKKKVEEVALLKESFHEQTDLYERPSRSMYQSFMESKEMNIISEFKRASPSKGDINIGLDPKEQSKMYERSGAGAISVLTDETFFKGSMEDLENVKQVVNVPVLCKDFIIDEIQMKRAKLAGADVVLLIAAALDQPALTQLHQAAKSLNLEVLLEVHNEEEMERALKLEANIIGINNRNLKTFEVDLTLSERLIQTYSRPDIVFISESGIRTKEEVERVARAGARGILVGETFMKSTDVAHTFSELKIRL